MAKPADQAPADQPAHQPQDKIVSPDEGTAPGPPQPSPSPTQEMPSATSDAAWAEVLDAQRAAEEAVAAAVQNVAESIGKE